MYICDIIYFPRSGPSLARHDLRSTWLGMFLASWSRSVLASFRPRRKAARNIAVARKKNKAHISPWDFMPVRLNLKPLALETSSNLEHVRRHVSSPMKLPGSFCCSAVLKKSNEKNRCWQCGEKMTGIIFKQVAMQRTFCSASCRTYFFEQPFYMVFARRWT